MDWCHTQLACFQASFMESPWTRPAPASLSTGVSYIPRAECGTEVSFGKSSFNIFPYYLCAPHADGVFLLLFPPYSGCLFLLLKPDYSWRIWSWFSSCAEIPENVSVGFDCVVCAFASVSSVCVSVLQDWDIQPLAGEELFLSFRESWFSSDVLLLGSFFVFFSNAGIFWV